MSSVITDFPKNTFVANFFGLMMRSSEYKAVIYPIALDLFRMFNLRGFVPFFRFKAVHYMYPIFMFYNIFYRELLDHKKECIARCSYVNFT